MACLACGRAYSGRGGAVDIADWLSGGHCMRVAGVGDQHGIPGSYAAGYRHRLLARHADHARAGGAGLGFVQAIDPPGGEGSDRSPRHSSSSWAQGTTGLADQQGLGRFARVRRGAADMAPVPERQREIRDAMTRMAGREQTGATKLRQAQGPCRSTGKGTAMSRFKFLGSAFGLATVVGSVAAVVVGVLPASAATIACTGGAPDANCFGLVASQPLRWRCLPA